MYEIIIKVIQIIVALGLLNVWLVRANLSTAYRGGNAKTLREEFAIYGLPGLFCSFVGVLKIGSAILLLAGLWFPAFILPTAILISILMIGAISMHFKVKDPIKKTIPALLMLIMSLTICCTS